jgi:hypothetical protein
MNKEEFGEEAGPFPLYILVGNSENLGYTITGSKFLFFRHNIILALSI